MRERRFRLPSVLVGPLGPWIFGTLIALIAYAPALVQWEKSGWGDWQQFHHWWEVGRISFFRFGEFPLFDPNHCGGVSMWGQPQAQHTAPTWWITGLAFGTVVGHKLFVLLHHVVGFVGMGVVGRRVYRLGAPAAWLAAMVWAFSGFFGWRAAGGHGTFLAFHYIPWIFYCWRRTNDDLRYAGGVAALMGLQLMEGGTYPFPLTFLVIAFDFVVQLAPPRPKWRVIRTAAITGTLTALIGSIRLWPVYVTMSRFPRETRMEDSQTVEDLIESLTARDPHAWVWGHRWVWAEYGSFIGWAMLTLAGFGALVAARRGHRWHLVLGAVVFGACAMGNVGPLWPWPLLHELPVFGNFHVPSRFHVLLTFYLVLLAGLAVDVAVKGARRASLTTGTQRMVVALAWVLVVAVGAEVVSNTVRIAARWDGPAVSGEPEDHFHLVGTQGYLQWYRDYPQRNVGTAACYDPVPWPISRRLWVGDRPQVRVQPGTAGALLEETRTNHTVTARVRLSTDARVVFNQNFGPEWVSSVGEVVEEDGLLAVDAPAGEHTIVMRFEPSDLPYSLGSFGLGCAGALGLALFAGRKRRRWRPRRRPTPDRAVEGREGDPPLAPVTAPSPQAPDHPALDALGTPGNSPPFREDGSGA